MDANVYMSALMIPFFHKKQTFNQHISKLYHHITIECLIYISIFFASEKEMIMLDVKHLITL